MRDSNNVFHLAIPCADLDAAAEFYADGLGVRLARRYNDRITLDFFGDQVVCHLAPHGIDPEPKMYPRHFGITFRERAEYDRVLEHARSKGLKFFKDEFVRFGGKREEHRTFFLIDPSNNLIEFKFYEDSEMMY
jgi:extradiol dioxygenase family protein